MGEMIFKVHNSYRMVMAVCDSDLLGKLFEEGEKQLDLTGEFFKGEEVDEEKLREEVDRCLAEDATFNIVGEKSIEFFKGLGVVKSEGVMEVSGVPFALVLL